MSSARRALCATCQRPSSTCLCQWVTPTPCIAEVLILQHPLEAGHVKNTARLLYLSLPGSRLLTGESFDDAELAKVLSNDRYNVLLYPPTAYAAHAVSAPLDSERLKDAGSVRLVVLDGTWRKSRKMLHLSPRLQALPRLSLSGAPASGYAIRKAHQPGQLSTLEATCAALAQLEGGVNRFQPLLSAFAGFVAQQQEFMQKAPAMPAGRA